MQIWEINYATQFRFCSFFRSLFRNKKTPWPESVSELYRPGDHRLSEKLVPPFANRGVPSGQRDGSLRP
jgi:hypothetical protein